jgi:hypothetical protein
VLTRVCLMPPRGVQKATISLAILTPAATLRREARPSLRVFSAGGSAGGRWHFRSPSCAGAHLSRFSLARPFGSRYPRPRRKPAECRPSARKCWDFPSSRVNPLGATPEDGSVLGDTLMGGKRRLKAGAQRLLGDHSRLSGKVFRRCYDALGEEFDLSSRLLQLEASRVALAWVNLDAASQALETIRRARETGKGQRPTTRDVERAARRQGLADTSYSQALSQLRSLAGPRKPLDLAEALAQARAEHDAEAGAHRSAQPSTTSPGDGGSPPRRTPI